MNSIFSVPGIEAVDFSVEVAILKKFRIYLDEIDKNAKIVKTRVSWHYILHYNWLQ